MWRKMLKNKSYDNFDNKDFSDDTVDKIRKDFLNFYIKSNKELLIEKEPKNIFNFLIIKKIFPYSKFIFIKKNSLKKFKTILRKTDARKIKIKIMILMIFWIRLKIKNF